MRVISSILDMQSSIYNNKNKNLVREGHIPKIHLSQNSHNPKMQSHTPILKRKT